MTIIVEDGSIVTNANSYVTEAELTAYAVARGVTISGDPEELLIKAMDYIEGLEFIGVKYQYDQPLQWPRAYVMLDSYWIDQDEIPQLLKDAQCESAITIDADIDPLANIDRVKQSTTVGVVSVTYATGSSATTIVRKLSNKLRKLLSGGSSNGISFKVDRG